MVAVRTTSNTLELPIGSNGEMKITNEYFEYLIDYSNKLFKKNAIKTGEFYNNLLTISKLSNINSDPDKIMYLSVPMCKIKAVKSILEENKLINKDITIQPNKNDVEKRLIPLSIKDETMIIENVEISELLGEVEIKYGKTPENTRIKPMDSFKCEIENYIQSKNTDVTKDILEQIPFQFEFVSDIFVIGKNSLNHPDWLKITELYEIISNIWKVDKIARYHEIDRGKFRSV